MLKAILVCVVIVIFLLLSIWKYYNKGNIILIKIKTAEKDIGDNLNKKKELLKESIPLLNEELHLDDFLIDFDSFFEKETDNFEINNFLDEAYNSFKVKIYDLEDDIKNEKLCKNIKELKKCDIELSAVIKYYNDSCISFNNFIKRFPISILKFFFRYNKKTLYDNEKKEIFDILNDK